MLPGGDLFLILGRLQSRQRCLDLQIVSNNECSMSASLLSFWIRKLKRSLFARIN